MQRPELESELRLHHAAAHGWALSLCRYQAAQAHDALQETYLRILDGRARFGGASSFRTWLFAVIRRVAAEQRRRARWRDVLAGRWLARTPTEEFAAPAGDDDAATLRRALRDLPARQREVLQLVFYHELSIAQAAETMGVTLGTARVHYERGKAALRARLRVEIAP